MRSLQQHQQVNCFLAQQVSSLRQQVEDLHQAAESSQAAHKQVVDQLKQALSDKDLLERQLQAVTMQGPAGSSMVTALLLHLWRCKTVVRRPMSLELMLPCSITACLCLQHACLPF